MISLRSSWKQSGTHLNKRLIPFVIKLKLLWSIGAYYLVVHCAYARLETNQYPFLLTTSSLLKKPKQQTSPMILPDTQGENPVKLIEHVDCHGAQISF